MLFINAALEPRLANNAVLEPRSANNAVLEPRSANNAVLEPRLVYIAADQLMLLVFRFLRGSVYQIPYTESLCLMILVSLEVEKVHSGSIILKNPNF